MLSPLIKNEIKTHLETHLSLQLEHCNILLAEIDSLENQIAFSNRMRLRAEEDLKLSIDTHTKGMLSSLQINRSLLRRLKKIEEFITSQSHDPSLFKEGFISHLEKLLIGNLETEMQYEEQNTTAREALAQYDEYNAPVPKGFISQITVGEIRKGKAMPMDDEMEKGKR